MSPFGSIDVGMALSIENFTVHVGDRIRTDIKTLFSRTFQDLKRPNATVFQDSKNSFSITFQDTLQIAENEMTI